MDRDGISNRRASKYHPATPVWLNHFTVIALSDSANCMERSNCVFIGLCEKVRLATVTARVVDEARRCRARACLHNGIDLGGFFGTGSSARRHRRLR